MAYLGLPRRRCSMSIDTAFTDIHDWINELTHARTHREAYTQRVGTTTITLGHITRVPSLLDQLRYAQKPTTGDGSTGYTSRPAAHVEALDTLIHIDIAAARWIRDLGEDDPTTTEACITKLHGLYPSTPTCGPRPKKPPCCTRHDIERDVRSWWTQARIMTGWDSPAWRPDNTCPACDKRGTLRVRLSASSALCIDCRETWTATTIGLLAEHIRHENADDDTTNTASA